MDEWLDELADALGESRLAPEELGAVLKVAREVAHGVERRFAPVSAFLIGVAVGRRSAGGSARDEAFADAVRATEELIPER